MAENASIFIPDISGYTEFVSRTELEHGAHIINELLEVLVESNDTQLTLGEVEGDALLFFRSGEPLPLSDMTTQAVSMFSNFHKQLRIMERDSICQCGACQNASNLSLKFVVHYGAIQPIRIAGLAKASGIDVIVAHRLLKNNLASREYVLATDKYFEAADSTNAAISGLEWKNASETYPAIGTVSFRYAMLDALRTSLPPAPPREPQVAQLNDRKIQVVIRAPMRQVYDTLIDYNARPGWVTGLRRGESEAPIDRISRKHYCYFDNYTVQIIPVNRVISDDRIEYAEEFSVVDKPVHGISEHLLERLGQEETRVTGQIGEIEGIRLSEKALQAVIAQMTSEFEDLKTFCESGKQ